MNVAPTSDLRAWLAHDGVALIADGHPVSYAELRLRVDAAGDALGGERSLLLLELGNDLGSLVWYLAALVGRHPVILTSPGADAATEELRRRYAPRMALRASDSAPRPLTDADPGIELHPELAVLMSTSGSTGSPKLVRLSHRNLLANAAAIAGSLGIEAADRAITTLPMSYCYGLSVVNSHLHAGASLVLSERSVVDRCFWSDLDAHRVTSFAGVPHTFEMLERSGIPERESRHLRYVTQAGGRMPPERVSAFARLGRERGWDLVVMYGQTEATARMAYLPPERTVDNPGSVGQAIPGGALSIDGGGAEGELLFRGPNVMMGYAETPADLARGAEIEVLRTGDIARRNANGFFEIVGRARRVIKPFGLRIDLDRLEAQLGTAGAPVSVAGDDHGLVLAAPGADGDSLRRRAAARTGLPAGRVAVRTDDPPRLAQGKVDYGALLARERGSVVAPGEPGDLRQIFARVLDVPDVTPTDTFVGLGGDSLSYVEMSVALEEALGHLPDDWHTTPVAELTPSGRRRRWLSWAETNVLLRAVAITLIVGTHADLFDLPAGAHVLLAIAGFNLARFQLNGGHHVRSILRVALPSSLWLALLSLVAGGYGVASVLLANNLVAGPDAAPPWRYWFVEVLVQILVVAFLLLAIPRVRAWERTRPFAFAMAVVVVAILLRHELFGTIEVSRLENHTLTALWAFALGWAAAQAGGWRERSLVSASALVAVPGFFDTGLQEAMVIGGVLALVWTPRVPIPRAGVRLAALVGGASLYIYLTHWEVYPPVQAELGPAAATIVSLVAGILVWLAADRVGERVAATARSLRPNRSLASRSRPRPPDEPAANAMTIAERAARSA